MQGSIQGLKAIPVLAVLLPLAGCATGGSIVQTPDVRLETVEVAGLSLDRQTFNLGFALDNPNPFPLPVRAIRYQIRLNEQPFVGGEAVSDMTVPAGGQGAFSLSVDFDLLESADDLASLLKTGARENIGYELHGKFDLDLPMVPSLAFTSQGTITTQTAAR